jgi:hypothetical protein
VTLVLASVDGHQMRPRKARRGTTSMLPVTAATWVMWQRMPAPARYGIVWRRWSAPQILVQEI